MACRSKKLTKLLNATKKQYGEKKGKKIGYATAKKMGWRV